LEHAHSLSLSFHLDQKSGAVIGAISKAEGIDGLLELLLFKIIAVSIDVVMVWCLLVYLMTGLGILLLLLWPFFLPHWFCNNGSILSYHTQNH
jgi:ABC-type transport system involved in Fe-S cluster assembly fused permease/ATPase subunit